MSYMLYLLTAYHSDHYNATLTLGDWFMQSIDYDTLDVVSVDDLIVELLFTFCVVQKLAYDYDEGIEKIEDGRAWAYFEIPPNYSENYVYRYGNVTVSVTIVY